jgi:trehalose synthase
VTVARIDEVSVQALTINRLADVLGAEREAEFATAAAQARTLLDGRTVLNVNSTAAGGGVAEMLQTLLAYARGAGIDTRWVVIEGDPEFFAVTKRIHNHLYGAPGDGGPLGAAERRAYEATLAANAEELRALVRPRDIIVLHDPQTLGLARTMRDAGATVVWRCHVGVDTPNEHSERGWEFLRPYLDSVDASVFTLRSFAPAWADADRVHVIAPSIDPFSTKNRDLSTDETGRVLRFAGLLSDGGGLEPTTFVRRDGSPGRVDHHADILQTGPPPPPDAPLITQVSRWDRMKDMPGVMAGFAEHVDDAHLVLAGPVVTGVTDDPEGGEVLEECIEAWRALPHAVRTRVHLACIPMHDPDENATIVNALQRHATIVTQKSLAEGFGLTVVEAMWKGRPIVASAVGGITEQIVDGEHGLLVDDPFDLDAFGRALCTLLDDPRLAEQLGEHARRRAGEEFVGDRHLREWAALFAHLEENDARS